MRILNFSRLYVSGFGISTTIVTAIIVTLLEQKTEFALYAWVILYFIPVGAVLTGAMAASGYYFGSIWTNTKPAGGISANMTLAGLSAYLMINYLPFYLLEIDGQPARDTLDFWMVLDYGIRNSPVWPNSIFAVDEAGPILGYGIQLVLLGGFVAGGFAVYGLLSSRSFCDTCARYRKWLYHDERYAANAEEFSRNARELTELTSRDRFQDAIAFHKGHMGSRDKSDLHLVKSVLEVSQCESCGSALLEFDTESLSDDHANSFEPTSVSATSHQPLNPATE